MRQVVNGKRTRGRSGRSKPSNQRNHTYDSSGPEGKVRGTANQVFEKYLALARDAQSSGDRIGAENFFQHAEHYYRIMNGFAQNERARSQGSNGASGMNGHGGDRRVPDSAGAETADQDAEADAAGAPQKSAAGDGAAAETAES